MNWFPKAIIWGSVALVVLGGVVLINNLVVPPEVRWPWQPQPTAVAPWQQSDVTIAVLITDTTRIPSRFVLPLVAAYPPVTLDMVASAPIDALLLSRMSLFEVSSTPAGRAVLTRLVDNGKMLLIYQGSTSDIQQALQEPLSTVRTTTTRVVVASLHRAADGIPVSGQLIVSPDRAPLGASEIRGYVENSLQE